MTPLEVGLHGAVLILVIMVVRGIPGLLPRRAVMLLWRIALLRLLLPVAIPFRWSVFSLLDRLSRPAVAPGAVGATAPALSVAIPREGISAAAPAAVPWWWIWGIGAAALAVFFAVSYLRSCMRFRRFSRPAGDGAARQWQETAGENPRVDLRVCTCIAVPLTYGVLRPVILLPQALEEAPAATLRFVLTHELVHIRRLDTLCKLLLAGALCLHWYNPAVWAMVFRMNRDMETACDEAVVRACGLSSRAEYAAALVRLEETKARGTPLFNSFSKYAIQERVKGIMKMKKLSICGAVAAGVVVCCTAAVFATSSYSGGDAPQQMSSETLESSAGTDSAGGSRRILPEPVEESAADDTGGAASRDSKDTGTAATANERMSEFALENDTEDDGGPLPEVVQPAQEFLWPTNGGMGFTYTGHTGNGMDIAPGGGGHPIYASRDGVVTHVENGYTGYGHYIILDHGDGYQTVYAHNSENHVAVGEQVAQGQEIGKIGRTGWTTGNCVHFEIRYQGRALWPGDFIGTGA